MLFDVVSFHGKCTADLPGSRVFKANEDDLCHDRCPSAEIQSSIDAIRASVQKRSTKTNALEISNWMSNCLRKCRMSHNKHSAPAVNQANIDSVTAELGRHTGDVGQTKRLEALETLMEQRQSDAASH